MINRPRLSAAVLAVILMSFGSISVAAPASDSASDPAYAAEAGGAWKGQYNVGDTFAPGQNPPGNDNGGNGFLPWNFTDANSAVTAGGFNGDGTLAPYGRLNHYIDGVDVATSTFNDLGAPAFALGTVPLPFGQANAVRPFAQPLGIGQVFSADIDTPAALEPLTGDAFPFAIIRFLNEAGALTLRTQAGNGLCCPGGFPWEYTDATGTADLGMTAGVGSISPTATSDGSSISLARTGANTGRLTLDGASVNVTFSAGAPAAVMFILFDNNAEGALGNPTGEHVFFFNNLQIVPEPSSLAMLLLSGLSLISTRFRVRAQHA